MVSSALHYSTSMPVNNSQTIREFEVLLALCIAAPKLQAVDKAAKLVEQLSPYILEAHTQVFLTSPYFREIEPSPIEALSYNLTTALLSIGVNHQSQLGNAVSQSLSTYISNCAKAAAVATNHETTNGDTDVPDVEGAIRVARITLSLLGFLDAAAAYAHFWTSSERLRLIERVQAMLSESFLVAAETAFSTIRNAHSSDRTIKEWKRHYRHYAAKGRPLGAMLLQRSFMSLLVASTSLFLVDADALKTHDILDYILSGRKLPGLTSVRNGEIDPSVVETMAAVASNEMSLLEDGADYLRLGSTWQQRLAFAVKANALTSYLICTMLDDDAADFDVLVEWLEDALADPIQVADEALVSAVLRCMALVGKTSPESAPSISKILSRFIVQGGAPADTVSIASKCLAFVLRMLSKDATIATLYSLGNVLSSGPAAEKAVMNGDLTNGVRSSTFYKSKTSTGSAISLRNTGEEETTIAHGNVVQAICVIAGRCEDDKIIALAQSMLLQKISRVSQSVDLRIVTEAATLAVKGGPLEFKSLLKLYVKLTQDGVAHQNKTLLVSVCNHHFSMLRLTKLTFPLGSQGPKPFVVHLGERFANI
jgi:phosphatidylinositol 4-kinase